LESRKLGVSILKRDGNFPEGKVIGIYTLESIRFLLFDGLLQGTNSLGAQDLNRKVILALIAQHPTV
jgi:hypothetical protein